jgi:sulfur carrier protein
MRLTVNGEARDVPDGVTVQALLEHLKLEPGPVAVEVNREIVPRAEHPARALAGGDVIEIVHLVGGG